MTTIKKLSMAALSTALVALGTIGTAPSARAAKFFGPTSYLSFDDSPFSGESFSDFYLEDFEDDLLNTPGVSVSNGVFGAYEKFRQYTDSVDSDDGIIDGWGSQGHHWYSNGTSSLTFTFDKNVLGSLPTHAGIVWTDVGYSSDPRGTAYGLVTFEAFNSQGTSLGVIEPTSVGDGTGLGYTAEDRFFGVHEDSGISAITISMNSNDFSVDHLQYGVPKSKPEPKSVPEPSFVLGLLLLGTCGAAGSFLKRKP